MPWTRQYRVPGKKWVVPAFPDAEEQVRSLVLHDGAVEGLIEGHGVVVMETVVDDVDGKVMRGEFDEHDDVFRKLQKVLMASDGVNISGSVGGYKYSAV